MPNNPFHDNQPVHTLELKKRARERMRSNRTEIQQMSREEVQALVYDLQLHQAELEIINEDLQETQQQLAQAYNSFTALYEEAPIAYLTLDENHCIKRANRAACSIFARDLNDLFGLNLSNLVPPEERDRCYLFLKSVKPGVRKTVEICFTAETGKVFWGQVHATTIGAGASEGTGFRVAIIDFTHEKQIEAQLRSSEERYRLLYEETPIVNTLVSLDGMILDINRWGLKSLGYKKEEVVGQPLSNFLIPEQRQFLNEQFHAGACGAILPELELSMYAKNGTVHQFLTVPGKAVLSHGDLLDGYICSALEITERKLAEEKLQQSQKEWVETFNLMPDLIAILDEHHTVIRANNAMAKKLGVSPEKAAGLSCFRCVHGTDKPPETCPHTLMLKDHKFHSVEIYEPNLGGDFIISVMPMLDPNGNIRGSVHIAHDITEQKQRERDLEAFSFSVAHDLRNPLNAMAVVLRLFTDESRERMNGMERSALQRIDQAVVRMGDIISDLLTLSKIARQQVRRKPVDLSTIVREIVNELKTADPLRVVTLEIKSECRTEADSGLTIILLENIIRNAWKFTSKGKETLIEFGTLEGTIPPVYYLHDNGTGFDVSKAEQHFKPFHRFHSDKDFSGTGIGLAIVERIVIKHGGRVWAESEVGKGATFFFTLSSPNSAKRMNGSYDAYIFPTKQTIAKPESD